MQSRHLYINGTRGVRTVLPDISYINSAKVSDTGYVVQSDDPLNWPNNGYEVEFVYTAEGSDWTESRCTVDSVKDLGDQTLNISMKQPCFTNLRNKQIGRAVQQECRDRSRMPSSA
eukprot:TRINITY_DN15239_c0_g1_i1.p1 TRINITY_DN15239_c0_g1~~TRINITY_DN15239_c0_g1_i1.p1  ORF type:complete len:136 (-),score=10.56 TRINITY_DN15239_c0_g1_i1:10-357(-)